MTDRADYRGTAPLAARDALRAVAAALVLTGCVAHVHPDPISPARPGLNESTSTVGSGTLQVEGGYSISGSEGQTRHALGEMMVRYGLGDRTELVLGLGSYGWAVTDAVTTAGASDAALGARVRMWEGAGLVPTAAVIGKVSLPTGTGTWRGEEFMPSGALALGWGAGRWSIATTAAYAHGSEAGELTTAVAVGTELGHHLHGHLEYGRIIGTQDGAEAVHHASIGLGYPISHDLQLDLWGGLASHYSEREALFGFGVSRRW